MTSMADTAEHPDVEELSDLSEGLLSLSRTADVRRHLDGCPLCADVYDSLTELRGLLGALPGPPRMPDDVADRISAALASEPRPHASSADTADGSTPKPPVPHVSRETLPSSPVGRPSGGPRAATGPGRPQRRRRGRRTVVLGAVITAAALGTGTLLVQTLGHDTGSVKAQQTASQPHTDAAHTYSEGTLQGQVRDLLSDRTSTDGGSSSAQSWGIESESGRPTSSGESPNRPLLGSGVTLPQCVAHALHQDVLAADKGVYRGTAVYLVVTPDASDASKVTAHIVDATCVKRDSASTGTVLLTHSYAVS